jgi:hypothetical protein
MRPGTGGASLWSLARSAKPDYPMKNVIIRILIYLTFNLKFKEMTVEKKNIWTVVVNTILTLITGIASVFGLNVLG